MRDTSLIAFLAEVGADVNASADKWKPPLHFAVADEMEDVVRTLIFWGADVNLRDGVGWPPLHWAASRTNTNVVRMLVDAGADLHAKDQSGQTALDHAWGTDSPRALLKSLDAP